MSSSAHTLSNFIGGAFLAPAAWEFLDDQDPATGAVIARVPRSTAAEVQFAVAAAGKAFSERWARARVAERADLLEAVAARMAAKADELAALESLDTGRPIALTKSLDIPSAEASFRFFASAIRHDVTHSHPMDGVLSYTRRAPVGVAALITPWNLPLDVLSWKTAPAIAMGNTVVAKPSELTPLTADALAGIFHEAGAPPGIFNIVYGLGSEAGGALISHPDVSLVSFTGSAATGAEVAATAAPLFKKLSLQPGGRNPTLVFADADPEAAVEGALRAGFLNPWQARSGSRVLVERSFHDRFLAALVERVKALRVGAPSDPATEVGALVSEAHRARMEATLALAREEGGSILCGGTRPVLPAPYDRGAFLTPAVVSGLSPHSRSATEEIPGPLVTVHPFDSEAGAVALANEVRHGLAATVWTRDLARAHRVAGALEARMVWVNSWPRRELREGVKDSGVGCDEGALSLEFFSHARNICVGL